MEKKARSPGDACRWNERVVERGTGGYGSAERNRRSDLPLIRARQNGIAFLRRFAALAKGRKKIGARGKKNRATVVGRAEKSSKRERAGRGRRTGE